MIYIAAFAFSGLFAAWATKFKSKKNRWMVFLLSAISIIIPSVLGGLRATSLGTDVQVYVMDHFNLACDTKNMWEFLTTFNTYTGREPLYRIIVYLVSLVSNDIHLLLFVFQFLTILLVYIGIYKHRNVISVPLVLLFFFFLFYNDTFNLMRQYLAMAIIFANIDKLEKKKYIHFIICIILAVLVHTTAIICIGMVVIHYYLYSGKLGNKLIRKIELVVAIAVAFLFFSQLVRLAVQLGILSSRYLYYFENDSVSSNNLATVLYFLQIVYCLLMAKKIKNTGSNEFYLLNNYVIFIILLASRWIYYGSRVSLFFALPNIIFLGKLSKIGKKGKNRVVVRLVILLIVIFYWWYLYIYGGVSQTYPYVFGG